MEIERELLALMRLGRARRVFERLAVEKPLVLIFDDVHWAAVLRSASAFEMYRKRRGRISPEGIVQFLLLDPEFPRLIRELHFMGGAFQPATTAREFDPAEIHHGEHATTMPPIAVAMAPLVVVICVNLLMSLVILPRMDATFLAQPQWGATSLAAVGGVWSVVVALPRLVSASACLVDNRHGAASVPG